jgi:methyltransferase (TIGR00027 family)
MKRMPPDEGIEHVSDTALMVAACRAMETTRTNGLVRDPFAERLAGARGTAIARGLERFELMCFGVGIRSKFLDDLLTHAIATYGIEMVLNLGAGLDTRPWRLPVPAAVRWIEVDFPPIQAYKRTILAADVPNCRVEWMSGDLSDASRRDAIFAGAGAAPGLMITEGLLAYLPGETVEALANSAARLSGIRLWLLDVASPAMSRRIRMDQEKSVTNVRAEGHIDGNQILDAVKAAGWTPLRHFSYNIDGRPAALERMSSLARASGAAEAPPGPPPLENDPSGAYLFGRADL